MSDIGIDIPFPILVAIAAAMYWPVTLTVALVLAGVGVVVQLLWVRAVCFVVAAVLTADCLLALWMASG